MFNIKSYYSLREEISYILKTCKKYNSQNNNIYETIYKNPGLVSEKPEIF
jgi:hypothetical protein